MSGGGEDQEQSGRWGKGCADFEDEKQDGASERRVRVMGKKLRDAEVDRGGDTNT